MTRLNVRKPHTPSKSDEVRDVEVRLVKRAMILKNPRVAILSFRDISKLQRQSLQEVRWSNVAAGCQSNLRFRLILRVGQWIPTSLLVPG